MNNEKVLIKLNALMELLVVFNFNFKVLHWNVKSLDFDNWHELMNEYSDKLTGYLDDIAEIIIMNGGKASNLSDICKCISDSKLIIVNTDNEYSPEEVAKLTLDMFEYLISAYIIIRNNVPSDIGSILDDHIFYLRKEKDYKLKKRLS